MTDIKFSHIGDGVSQGEIVKWLVKEGDYVEENENIVHIETYKAVIEVTTPQSGKMSKIQVKEGTVVKVGETLACIE